MATKLDFLKDLREHPNTTGGETAARLDVSEGAVLEAYRRSRRQGLLEGDGGRPEKFKLSDFGSQQLRVLSGEESASAVPPTSSDTKFSELQERMNDAAEDIRGLFRIVDSVLRSKRTSVPESDNLLEELQQENTQLEEQLGQQAKLFEFYAVRIGLAERDRRKHLLKERGKRLAEELKPETAKLVERLVSLEEELCTEKSRFLGRREEKVRKFQAEIAPLREKLGFAAEPLEQAEGEASKKDDDSW